MSKEIVVNSKEQLEALLGRTIAPGVLSLWGTGTYKDIQRLWEEILGNEINLVLKKGETVRLTRVVFLNLRYNNSGVEYELVEDKKVFKDGREVKREMPGSAGEKLHIDETFNEAEKRLREEELKNMRFSWEGCTRRKMRTWSENTESRSYPGLKNESQNVLFEVNLKPNQGDPQDFQVDEENATTYFKWKKV